MQPTTSGGGGGGLTRFRSAPATWLDALLESVADEDDHQHPLKPPLPLPPQHHPTELFDGAVSGLFRQNSLPVEFVSSDNYYEATLGTPSNYDFTPSPSSKRPREMGVKLDADQFSSQLKEEDQGEYFEKGLNGLFDPEMEKLLEDSVPLRVRAKRGCATHPRSIAERVRRTRISDRIRKLQELVPNMEKQTNTADMLEEAVEYVKFLQRQIQELTEQQKDCKCVPKE